MTPWFVAQLVVALAVVALVLGWRHLGVDRARWALSTVVVVDLALFGLSSATGFASATADVVEPSKAEATNVLGSEGRFAIYHPASNYVLLGAIGQPDLNVFTTLPSVQGYGSIVDNTYGRPPVPTSSTRSTDAPWPAGSSRRCGCARCSPVPASWPPRSRAPGRCRARPRPARGHGRPARPSERTWYFGQALTLTGATLATPGRSASTALAGLEGGRAQGGRRRRLSGRSESGPPATTPPWPSTRQRAPLDWSSGGTPGRCRIPPRSPPPMALVTPWTAASRTPSASPGWAFTGTWAGNARFERTSVRPPVWLQNGPAGATATQVGIATTARRSTG